MARARSRHGLLHKHSLSITASLILVLWIVLYSRSSTETHWGSFFGNAIADWSGLVVMVVATKYLYERGSKESRRPPRNPTLTQSWIFSLQAHSLTLFLIITGLGWVILFSRMDPNGRWGQVVGNIVSEWIQVLGVVLLTKKLVEVRSKE